MSRSSVWYPSVEDILAIHEDIVEESSDTTTGVQNRGSVEFALDYVERGSFDAAPETIHETAFHLLRLLVANHPFVDGNKRTALNTIAVFYFFNGYRFEYDDEIRTVLKAFGMSESDVDEDEVIDYLRNHTTALDIDEAIERWREDLVRHGIDRLTDDSGDPND